MGKGRARRRPSEPGTAETAPSDVLHLLGQARRHVQVLSGRLVEGVSGLGATEDGHEVTVEVLELRRIPR